MKNKIEKIKNTYKIAKKNLDKIIVGALLVGFSTSCLEQILNTKRGSFIDPQNGKKYEYSLSVMGNSRHLYTTREGTNGIFSSKIRDLDADGNIDHVGSFTYPRMPFEFNMLETRPDYREWAQRQYNLALADAKIQ